MTYEANNTDMEEAWKKLSNISCSFTLNITPYVVPSLKDEIDGFAIYFRRFAWGLFVLLLCIGVFLFGIAYFIPIDWFWTYGPLGFGLTIALFILLSAGLSRLPLAEVRWQHGRTTIRRRYVFRTRQVCVSADDLTVIFDVVTASNAWPDGWLGKGMILLKHRSFPNQPIVVAVARGKRFWSLCNELSRQQNLTIEDKTVEPVVLADGMTFHVRREALAIESANFRTAWLRFIGDNLATVRPTLYVRLFFGIVLFVGLSAIYMGVAGSFGRHNLLDTGRLIAIGVGIPFMLLGGIGFWGFNHRGIIFDRNSQTVSVRYGVLTAFKNRPVYSFADIVAVQLCARFIEGSEGDPGYKTMEMNLVLADPAGERIMLASHGKESILRREAHALAEFLGKPLIDHTRARGIN